MARDNAEVKINHPTVSLLIDVEECSIPAARGVRLDPNVLMACGYRTGSFLGPCVPV